MPKHQPIIRRLLLITTILCLLSTTAFPLLTANADTQQAFTRGVTWRPYVPLKKVTFVAQQQGTTLDDYAYLAAVPTAVFYDKDTQTLYTNPLLFFEEPHPGTSLDDRFLNTRQGIDYFMDDWMAYCNGQLDALTTINIDPSALNPDWTARSSTSITGTDAPTIANRLALNDWSYADTAVVAVIDPTAPTPGNQTHGTLTGTVTTQRGLLTQHFDVPQTHEIYPIYNEFTVPDGYKMLYIRSWYPSVYINLGRGGFQGIINMSVPAGDRDLQVYCQKNGQWMMAGIVAAWNAMMGMDRDFVSTYVYNPGKWSVALTDAPTKTLSDTTQQTPIERNRNFLFFHFGRYGKILDVLKDMNKVTYQIDVNMYPGTTLTIPDLPPYGCRNASITLTWNDPNVDLGFSLIGPSGEEVLSTREAGVSTTCPAPEVEGAIPYPDGTSTNMHLTGLGECLPGEHYSICVYTETPLATDCPFTIEYSWQQNMTRCYGDSLDSATNAAVLASLLNAPLLYASAASAPAPTTSALTTLGTKHLYIVDLHGTINTATKTALTEGITDTHYLTTYNDTYAAIRTLSGKNDIIFSTVNSWTMDNATYIPGPVKDGELSVGPAAYLAAQHGSPVLFIENHPQFSSAVIYHNELWRRHSDGLSKEPSVAEMYLTGTRVYSYLKQLGYDKENDEILITIGGQYEIGFPWDRMFVGKAQPGRFFGSPTDLSVWITKTIFYPQIVFQNPALLDPNGVTLINGSSSIRRFPWRGKLGLKITKPAGEVTLQYPALNTLVCYEEKFNTRASQYWGFKYKCADGTIPGETASFNPIDSGDMLAVSGQAGAYLPDMSAAEVQTFYLNQGGYSPVYSTNFDANMNDLNQGVLLWLINTHGGPRDGGVLMFWDPTGQNPDAKGTFPLAAETKEVNPWRGYEWLMGSTTEPDTMTMQIHGLIATLLGNPDPRIGLITTGLDFALAKRPVRDIIGNIASLPILRLIFPEWLRNTQDYYDGVVITLLATRLGTAYYNGSDVDDALGNIHSVSISSVACLPAGKYLHITLMRHGSVVQIMDPWATSWYSGVWQNSVPRGIALGETMGQIYEEGIKKVGIQYISEPPVWWWDLEENVCLYGDPNLRTWVPGTTFSTLNHWEPSDVQSLIYEPSQGFAVAGHAPFGTAEHPNVRQAPLLSFTMLLAILVIVGILVIVAFALVVRRRRH